MRIAVMSALEEGEAITSMRQKYFFGRIPIKDPYLKMPFNNPDRGATHPDDRAMGKYL